MDQPLIVSKVEIDEILRLLPSDEAQRTLSFIDALNLKIAVEVNGALARQPKLAG